MKVGNIQKNNYEIYILPNDTDDFEFLSIVNGLYTPKGGNHIQFILDKIIPPIREKLSKKHKSIKPADIKNKIKLITLFRFFPNPEFNSQTKEFLANSHKEIDEFLKDIDWDKIAKKLLQNKELINSITEYYKIKEEFKQRQELKKTQKKIKKVISDKYIPSIGKKKYLVLGEGDSAVSSISKWLGRKEFGYISMFGVPMNTWEENVSKIANSKKFIEIQAICGIDYVEKIANPQYENIVIATDFDIYGHKICGLLTAYFYKFAKNLFKEKRIFRLKTPLIVAFNKNKLIDYFFSFESYRKFEKEHQNENITYEYNKGLGSLDLNILKQIEKEVGLEGLLEPLELTDEAKEILDLWFNKKLSDKRKEILKENPFNINML